MISGTFLILAMSTLALAYFLTRRNKWKNSPPGPRRLPFVGNLLALEPLQYRSYSKWANEFGPIVRVDLATTKTVLISDYKMVKEIFSETAFTGRMDFTIFDFIPDGRLHGIVNTEGDNWEELRRFSLRQLRDFGFGKTTMEESIMAEVNELLEVLKEGEDKPMNNVKDKLFLAVVNSLWAIATGKRHKQNDAGLLAMTKKANETFNEMLENGAVVLFLPILAKIFPIWSGYRKIRHAVDEFAAYFKKPIEEHKKTFDENYDRDFIDVFLKEVRKSTNPNSAFHGQFGEDNLQAVLGDLYFAGSDTTSTTLSWMILYLSKFQDIQKKFQQEIEAVTGNTRTVSVTDKAKMPYTEALLAETLRFSSIVPQGVQHRAVKDQEFRGYMIPKDTVITANLYHIHHDPKIWVDPENFRPERFLSPDGKTFKKHDALLPFSIGRRQCLGESLARDSLFLFSTNIFQRFSIQFDTSGPDFGWEPKVSFVITPKPYSVILKDRLA